MICILCLGSTSRFKSADVQAQTPGAGTSTGADEPLQYSTNGQKQRYKVGVMSKWKVGLLGQAHPVVGSSAERYTKRDSGMAAIVLDFDEQAHHLQVSTLCSNCTASGWRMAFCACLSDCLQHQSYLKPQGTTNSQLEAACSPMASPALEV